MAWQRAGGSLALLHACSLPSCLPTALAAQGHRLPPVWRQPARRLWGQPAGRQQQEAASAWRRAAAVTAAAAVGGAAGAAAAEGAKQEIACSACGSQAGKAVGGRRARQHQSILQASGLAPRCWRRRQGRRRQGPRQRQLLPLRRSRPRECKGWGCGGAGAGVGRLPLHHGLAQPLTPSHLPLCRAVVGWRLPQQVKSLLHSDRLPAAGRLELSWEIWRLLCALISVRLEQQPALEICLQSMQFCCKLHRC